MSEIETQLQQLGSEFYQAKNTVDQMKVESQISNLKHDPECCRALCNLISNPQTNESLALFYINIVKTESKNLFSGIKPSPFGKSSKICI